MLHVSREPSVPIVVGEDFIRDHPGCVLADVRWYLDGRDGRTAFEAGHLPGARFVDLDHELSAVGLPATEGRHPFPSAEDFAAAMGRLGIGDESVVIAYDDASGANAARLVVMLRMLGHDAALLDGGLAGWSGPLEEGPTALCSPARFTTQPWPSARFATADETAEHAAAGAPVLDARSAERYRGEVVLVDRRPGHIPGARSAPWAATLDEGRFADRDALREHYVRLGVSTETPAIAYCGSGVSACMNLVAMEHAGLPQGRLFVPSWSGWSADPERPAETGA
jgi:thiosulfate/3-mercaptopyruvate sulfurtransferase